MEKIILCGAGGGLKAANDFLQSLASFEPIEIWDNEKSKQGRIVSIAGKNLIIKAPHRILGVPIVITAVDYHDEIKKGLIELGIEEIDIKKRNYLFHFYQEEILKKYRDSDDVEIAKAISWIEKEGLDIFNGKWSVKTQDKVEVFRDETNGMYYVLWKGKPLFLKREYDTPSKVQDYMSGILKEQLPESPHCYSQDGIVPEQNDVVLDAGAAEGFFALEYVDIAKQIVLVEMDSSWIEALNATFAPYMDRVSIIHKALTDKNGEYDVSLNSICNDIPISYVKMDIEGYETVVLSSVKKNSIKNVRCIKACTYHRHDDEVVIERILKDLGFTTHHSDGFMFFAYDNLIAPDLRRGLVVGVV